MFLSNIHLFFKRSPFNLVIFYIYEMRMEGTIRYHRAKSLSRKIVTRQDIMVVNATESQEHGHYLTYKNGDTQKGKIPKKERFFSNIYQIHCYVRTKLFGVYICFIYCIHICPKTNIYCIHIFVSFMIMNLLKLRALVVFRNVKDSYGYTRFF